MFYSEQLLRKDGPLAYVWLAANMERKLSRSQFLKTDISDSVEAIVDSNGAPLALRLSGQLLLGVVRIYSRKTVYLMEDCNEALLKLKMAFRVGGSRNNVDNERHGAAGVTVARPQTLTLQNRVTELDLLLMPEPNLDLGPGFPMFHKPKSGLEGSSQNVSSLRDITLPDLDDTVDIGRGASRALDLDVMGGGEEELDLGLDFAMIGEEEALPEPDVEMGLGAGEAEADMNIDIGLEEELGLPSSPRAEENLLGPASPATPTHDADILGENVSVVGHEENHGGEGARIIQSLARPTLPRCSSRALRRKAWARHLSHQQPRDVLVPFAAHRWMKLRSYTPLIRLFARIARQSSGSAVCYLRTLPALPWHHWRWTPIGLWMLPTGPCVSMLTCRDW